MLNTSGWAVVQLIAEAGPVAKGVLVVLGVFSVLCWALIIEKWWQFRQVGQQTAAFQRAAREGRRAALVYTAAKKFRESPLAQLYVAGHQELGGFAEVPGPLGEEGEEEGLPRERLEAVERALRRVATLEVARLERYLPFLATTASACPFIGLFGTVWGIISAFQGIGQQGSASLAVVAPGISEALIATAAGLGAAIPAVMAYNYFVNRVKHWATEMEGFALELLNALARPVAQATRAAKDGV